MRGGTTYVMLCTACQILSFRRAVDWQGDLHNVLPDGVCDSRIG